MGAFWETTRFELPTCRGLELVSSPKPCVNDESLVCITGMLIVRKIGLTRFRATLRAGTVIFSGAQPVQ